MSADDIKGKIDEAARLLKPADEESISEEIHHFREEFAKRIDEAKIDLLVVLIDDLGRCLPATAIDTLEVIRLFLFVPKTAFIIGADAGLIEYAVRQHFPNPAAGIRPAGGTGRCPGDCDFSAENDLQSWFLLWVRFELTT